MKKCRYSLGRSMPWNCWVMDPARFCSFTCSSGGAAVLTQEFLLLKNPGSLAGEQSAVNSLLSLNTAKRMSCEVSLSSCSAAPAVSVKHPHVWPKMSPACLETSPRMWLKVCGEEKEIRGKPSAQTLAKLTEGAFSHLELSGLGVSIEFPRPWTTRAESKQMAERIRNMEMNLFQVAECI